jgi:DNA anti-recombination protein RmuC
MSELTKEHFEKIVGKLGAQLTGLSGKIDTMETKLTTKVAGVETKLMAEIDSLAIAVSEGFTDVMERFEKVDARFEKVDARLDGVDGRLDSMGNSLKFLELGQTNIQLRLDSMAPRFEVKELARQITSLQVKKPK